jgi:hypothetical protein
MKVYGQVKNGLVVPDAGSALPEGARVIIQIIADTPAEKEEEMESRGTGRRAYSRFAGIIDDLPSDASENVDHYLYGHLRR